MTPTEALAAISDLVDAWNREAESTDGGLADGLFGCADEVQKILEKVAPAVPPGRCGAPAPGDVVLICELLAGHAGMHQARQYPVGIASTGFVNYWHEVPA